MWLWSQGSLQELILWMHDHRFLESVSARHGICSAWFPISPFNNCLTRYKVPIICWRLSVSPARLLETTLVIFLELQWITAATSVLLLTSIMMYPPTEKISFLVLLLASDIPTNSQSSEFPRLGIIKSVLSALARFISLTAVVKSIFCGFTVPAS